MTPGLARRAAWLLLAAWSAWLWSPSTLAQASTHEVHRGDTLFGIARKTKHDGVSRNQMILAIYRANQTAFQGGNINLLAVGTVLTIPDKAAVAGIAPAEADRLVGEMIAKPAAAAAVPPAAQPAPPKPAASKPATGVPASRDELARRYRDGLALEQRGDDQGALKAFLEAGEGGYGPAQKKLGEIYDKGNSAVPRDYQTALQWYQKAREQGVEIPKPFVRSPR
jgi:pilus assembly protein FimV